MFTGTADQNGQDKSADRLIKYVALFMHSLVLFFHARSLSDWSLAVVDGFFQ